LMVGGVTVPMEMPAPVEGVVWPFGCRHAAGGRVLSALW